MTSLRTTAALLLLAFLFSIPATAELSQESITYGIGNTSIVNATSNSLTLENGTIIPLGEKNVPALMQNITASPLIPGGTYLLYNSANYARRVPMVVTDASKYPAYDPGQSVRINQGDCVSLGETIDIAGDSWYTGQLNYYGVFMDDYSQGPNDTILKTFTYSDKNASALYIDPLFFAAYPGWWYFSNHLEGHPPAWLETDHIPPSNDRAFFVGGDSCPEVNQSKNLIQLALNQSRIEAAIQANLTALPVKKDELGADFIISKNLTTTIDTTPAHQWLIGTGSTPDMYDVPVQKTIIFTDKETRDLPSGVYHNILIPADRNGVFDVRYDPETRSLISPFRDVENRSVVGLQPSQVESVLLQQVSASYAPQYTLQTIDFQDPAITLTKFDQWQDLHNNTVFSLAGYTNNNPGDTVTIRLDANRTYPESDGSRIWITKVSPHANMGDYREWTIGLKVDLNTLSKGPHWFTIDTNNGAHMDATFYVREEPAPNHQPEVFLKYIGSSPFVPPVFINTTVTVQVPGPTQYVYVNVTPAPEEVQAAADRSTWAAVDLIAEEIAVILVIFGLAAWAYSAYRRARR